MVTAVAVAGLVRARVAKRRGSLARETLRLLPLLVPVTVGGLVAVAVAARTFAASGVNLGVLAGVLVLLCAAVFAEAFPVPVANLPAGQVSISSVFIVGTALLYGWAPAVVVAFLTRVTMEVAGRRPPIRLVYNGGVYALSALAGAVAAAQLSRSGSVGWLLLQVLVAQIGFCSVNVPLVAGIVSLWARQSFWALLRKWIVWTGPAFALMASVTLMLDALWERSPILAASLLGPMVAIGLYQRSMHKALQAMSLALTDPLTGLGNHRHFHERLQAELESALAQGTKLAVCLLDLDNFKQINDRYGHPAGDHLLCEVAESLRVCGNAFRLGGDEFALLLPACDVGEAHAVAEDAIRRLAERRFEHGSAVSFSAGVAAAPTHAHDRGELVRVADIALYWAKAEGKNRVGAYQADSPPLVELKHIAGGRSREARLLAASSLAHAVDARDAYVGGHSERVAELAATLAARMGMNGDEVELIRLAGRLHDLGKLAVPEEILCKTGALTRAERAVLERHAQIGHQMLEPLGIDPIATWVRHHHERYDGDGYPDALAGEAIPLGARILGLADAYDAMTSERAYRRALPHEAGVDEIARCAGTQFDSKVVAAFLAQLGASPQPALAALAS